MALDMIKQNAETLIELFSSYERLSQIKDKDSSLKKEKIKRYILFLTTSIQKLVEEEKSKNA